MRKALVYQHGVAAGYLIKKEKTYEFHYLAGYEGVAISLTMPVKDEPYIFESFPPFFDGLLPEGYMLESLLERCKIDRTDYFSQLVTVGANMVGSVAVKEIID
ncbi:HipA N-terminal domain protein [Denitrovibrio acetiphilus DSM 12809]|uniref:HipA N-terminal domain protein n=1 Tax=Denitrovibrio acetiphilus (strain DSM 12809 / NBRC 114555 / N2460) TaxID=522772 RepID=D4H6Y1_DENA2|nr:HipA N-terminal domain-containing protein [Denitrovibrio acetiphilus]ADD67847.1 HipA N-terminal domain protein [Denitrovibrio acetiphilus DSM 12809]